MHSVDAYERLLEKYQAFVNSLLDSLKPDKNEDPSDILYNEAFYLGFSHAHDKLIKGLTKEGESILENYSTVYNPIKLQDDLMEINKDANVIFRQMYSKKKP